MKFYRPRSILQLILIGFGVVALPLIVALITAVVYVDRLTEEGQRAVYEAAHAIQSSRMLVEQLTAMERSARQYEVLGDHSLYKAYSTRRNEFLQTLQDLRRLNLQKAHRSLLDQLSTREHALFDRLRAIAPGSKEGGAAVAEFPDLAAIARAILNESSQLVTRGVDHMQQASARAQRVLIWQLAALIPTALGLSALFVILIARPLRQIDHAIRQLGAGEFSPEIKISGPQDLEELGKRLDWMRLRLLELENQKVMFLRHMSHELKTPLTTIREGSELLNEQVVGNLNDEQAEIAQLLRSNSLQLQKLIENLLNFSIAQSPTPCMDRRPVQLHNLVESVVLDHKLAGKAKRLRITTALTETTVIGDQEKLKIVLDNLVSNAVKYSPAGGTIDISLTKSGDRAVFDVRDQGPGIAPEERQRIFEAFYQGRASYEGHVKGSGLGLSITRQYVMSHKGSIDVIDRRNGAHLRVTLPLTALQA